MDIKGKLAEARRCINQAIIGVEERDKSDVFELRIPNLHSNEVAFVRSEIRIFTKKLLNQIQEHRNNDKPHPIASN